MWFQLLRPALLAVGWSGCALCNSKNLLFVLCSRMLNLLMNAEQFSTAKLNELERRTRKLEAQQEESRTTKRVDEDIGKVVFACKSPIVSIVLMPSCFTATSCPAGQIELFSIRKCRNTDGGSHLHCRNTWRSRNF